jgi:threonine dehydrogenase-like Zn-dependent dehydrogenase
LRWAKKLVPRVYTVQISKTEKAREITEKIRLLGGVEGIQCAMECTGVESSVSTAIYVPNPHTLFVVPVDGGE